MLLSPFVLFVTFVVSLHPISLAHKAAKSRWGHGAKPKRRSDLGTGFRLLLKKRSGEVDKIHKGAIFLAQTK